MVAHPAGHLFGASIIEHHCAVFGPCYQVLVAIVDSEFDRSMKLLAGVTPFVACHMLTIFNILQVQLRVEGGECHKIAVHTQIETVNCIVFPELEHLHHPDVVDPQVAINRGCQDLGASHGYFCH